MLANLLSKAHIAAVPERDENTEAVRNVEKATDSEPARGETLLWSRTLKRELAKARERLHYGRKRKRR